MNTAITLTPNRRLASFLRQKTPGKIIAWNDWLLEIWQTQYEWITHDAPLQCLNDWQTLVLWEMIITQHQDNPLLNKPQAVQHARQAWSLAIQWECDPTTWKGEKSETDSFLHWLEAYQAYCRAHHLLDRTLLPQVLLKYWQEQPQHLPQHITLAGFDEFTPLQTSMINVWQSYACDVIIEPPPQVSRPYAYLAFNDRETQLTQAALYAKKVLSDSPALPIGIIIPAIQDDWANIHDTFTAILGADQPFNISAGQPLGQCPIIDAALQCLQNDAIHYLLNTPYIAGGMSELTARARCDQSLLKYEKDILPMHFVRSHAALPEIFSLLLNQTLDLLSHFETLRLLPSQWIEKLFALLQAWGWPGDRTLSSEAYQAVKHFYVIVTELSGLDCITGACSYQRVLSLLSRRVHQTMFQPESQDKPIQVLGFLEAAGLSFSHLWVMDMGSDTWPSKPSPNPYIPMDVQIKLGIPHASFARELRFAQTMTQRMLGCADTIIMSYAAHGDEGETTVLPTRLLSQAPMAADVWGLQSFVSLSHQLFGSGSCEPMIEPIGLPLNQFRIKGGATVFEDQSDCPFRAYAKHRLSAKSLEKPTMGLSFRAKGTILHNVLEIMWKQLKNHETLLTMNDALLVEKLTDAMIQCLNQVQPPLAHIERELEIKRMLPLLKDWFEMELNRGAFDVVALEKHLSVTFEGLQMDVRIDRIDMIKDKMCIIDYKSGKINADQPQLPFYACVSSPSPQAIAFAEIRKDKMGWKGVGQCDLPGITPVDASEWTAQMAEWKNELSALATEYKKGHATPIPKNGPATCQHCDLHGLCRINDAQ